MALDGVWTMTDSGEFILDEPYRSQLREVRLAATAAWTDTVLEYLDARTPYTVGELKEELLRRVNEEGMSADEIVNEFVLEALTGDL